MKKTFVLATCIFIFVFSASALSVTSTFQTFIMIPQNSLCAANTFEFNFSDSNLHLDPYIGLGYSVRYYHKGESKALIYGPTLRLGLNTVREFNDYSLSLSIGAEGVYANFPNILFFGTELSFCRMFRNGGNYRISVGMMTCKNDWTVKLGLGRTWSLK